MVEVSMSAPSSGARCPIPPVYTEDTLEHVGAPLRDTDVVTGPGERWREVARRGSGAGYARRYADRFARLEAAGEDVHGEAAYMAGLLPTSARVLDAGCGTGRVAARLADLGFDVVGVDADESMVEVARELRPDLAWIVSDLGTLDLRDARFDAAVLAGNVVPFLEMDALPTVAGRLAALLVPRGIVVAGFGLGTAHLPAGAPVVPQTAYDEAMASAGFRLEARLSGWDGTPYAGHGYAVSVHRAGGAETDGS
jgi:SAM-dependent methyltransferase